MSTASSSSSKAAASSWIWPIVVALLAPMLYVFSIAPVGCMIGYYDVLDMWMIKQISPATAREYGY